MTIPLDATVGQRAAWLRQAGIWAALSEPALQAVAAAMQPAVHPKGQVIIRQGEPGRHLHVLTRGEAEVRLRADHGAAITLATMPAGACFGEMSLLSGDVTSADVVAGSDCETLALDRPAFEKLVANEPQLLREFVRMVSRRLKDSNLAMGEAREKEKELTRFLQDAHNGQYADLADRLPGMRALQRDVEALAPLDTPVLIQGERGTGKELIARLIHFRGPRRDAPLLSTDCTQIAETPWGDKLFGEHRRGADGRKSAGVSYLDLARGGTIVLKNIDSLPHPIQERLAEFIATGNGASQEEGGGVRIIATCRTDFRELAAAQKVSPALAQGLAAQVVAIPPLRERKRAIPELAAHFVRKHSARLGKRAATLDDQSVRKLVTHDYLHANVSELEEVIRRAVILTDGERIESEAIFLGRPPAPSRWAFNLLSLPRPIVRRALALFPGGVRILVAAVFVFLLFGTLASPAGRAGNLATTVLWSVGWPLLVVSLLVAGRACCAVCPVSAAADAAQRLVHFKWRIPAWLKRHDGIVLVAGFVAIIWAEEATGMRHSARATGVLLLAITAGAVAAAILLPRRTWCRHLCPLGGFLSLGSMAGLVELRPTPDICAAKCKEHFCYKGDERVDGCPLFNHVMFVDSNQHCVLCMNCVHTCPNDSPQLNLRPPARDFVTSTSDRPRAGWWTAVLAGLLVALVAIQYGERASGGALAAILHEQRLLGVTALLALGATIPLAGLTLLTRRFRFASNPAAEESFWQKVSAWAPVVIAGFVCYQLAYVPQFESLRVTLAAPSPDGPGREVSFALLRVVQGAVLLAGLLVTLGVLWNLGQRSRAVSVSDSE